MRIIGTHKTMNNQTPNYNNQTNTKRSKFGKLVIGHWLLLGYCCLVIGVLLGCGQKENPQLAQDYARKSEAYYEKAAAEYKGLIAKGRDVDKLYFSLGQLYYGHGEFKKAAEEFRKSQEARAKKFLAIAYYRLGEFTDALEIFNQKDSGDDEYLYYFGLTCERLNLFDKALDAYKKIKGADFGPLALVRSNNIEKGISPAQFKDISAQANKILVSAPAQELYPQAGALILSCDESVEITAQNTQVSYLHYLIKILNERGKQDFSETHIEYDSTYEKVELEYARTIRPDGRVIEVGSRHIRDVSKYLNFPLYSNARIYIISFPEISEGATIEYRARVYRNQLINKKDFVLSYPLQASEPIIAANFSVTIPKEKTLYLKTLNGEYNNFAAELSPRIKDEGSRLIYTWQFKDIPQIIPEANMPPQVEVNPTLLISTFSSWQEVYAWWWSLAQGKIKADSAMQEKVRQLTQGAVSDEAKIRAIYNFCAQKIRYVAVEYGQAGYEPHPAADIFKNKYGDCKDQAILLIALLKEAGISGWPVLIATKEHYNLIEDFPAMLFNHCIAAVAAGDKIIFLDPTAETCAFGDLPAGDQGRKVLIFKESGCQIQSIPFYPAGHNLARQELRIKANPDETIAAEKSVFTHGVYDQAQRFWLLYTPPELIREQLQEKIQDVSIGAKLNTYDIKNLDDLNQPLVLTYAFQGPEYFSPAGRLRLMPQLVRLDTAVVAKDKRKYNIDLDILEAQEAVFEIEIPDNLVVKYMPADVSADTPWLKFEVDYQRKEGKIICTQKTMWKKSLIIKNEYADFKIFFEGLAKKIKQRIVLEKKK